MRMRHFEKHLDHAEAGLSAAMERAGFEPSITLAHGFLSRPHGCTPHGVAVYGPDAETVNRAARWVESWGAKHQLAEDPGGVIECGALSRETLSLQTGPLAARGPCVAFVVFHRGWFD